MHTHCMYYPYMILCSVHCVSCLKATQDKAYGSVRWLGFQRMVENFSSRKFTLWNINADLACIMHSASGIGASVGGRFG